MGKTLRLFILASVVMAPSAYAQVHSSAGTATSTPVVGSGAAASSALNDARNNIDSQFASAIDAQQQAVSQAQMALQDCAAQQQRAYNDAAGQQAQNQGQQKQQAAQDAANSLPDTLGPLANAITGGGNKQRKLGQQQMQNVMTQVDNLNRDIAVATGQDPNTINSAAAGSSSSGFLSKLPFVGNHSGAAPVNSNAAITVSSFGVQVNQRARISEACKNEQFQISYGGFGMSNGTANSPVYYGGSPEYMCLQNMNSMVMSLNNQFNQGRTAYVGGQSLGGAAMQSGLNSLVGALGAGMKAKANNDNNKMQNDAANQNADLDRQICEQQAQAQIAEAQKQLQNLQNQRSRALLDANLQAAAANQANAATPLLAGNGAGGTVNVGDAPTLPTAAPSAIAAGNSNNGGGGGAAGAVAPSGGGNSAGTAAEWTFGSGGPAAVAASGPLPGASFEQAGGGGGGAGFGGGDSSGFATDPLMDMNKFYGDRSVASDAPGGPLGDGGINVLINRSRGVLSNYAPTLVKSLDLKKIMAMSPSKPIQAQ
ncbi:MAG: hypothetical protein JST16_15375 [Bdellovibrionales bacterium]|nr:hypothetical protein [Bdellovibrionales bacterium]